MINKSNEMIVNITTTIPSVYTNTTLNAYVDPVYYNIVIDDDATSIESSFNMTLLFTNTGEFNVTIESVYVNDTYIPLSQLYAYFNDTWVPLTSSNIEAFEIGIGDTMELTISVNDLELITGLTINVDDEIVITIRTKEGAEIIHEVTVT